MSVDGILRKTSLYEKHIALQGRMIPFAGWELPVQYTSIIEEHCRVRDCAGLFDVSHMGKTRIHGKDAFALLQYLSCNDLEKLKKGQAQYNLLLKEDGGVVDDVLLYQDDSDDFFLVSNAVNQEKVRAHLQRFSRELSLKLRIIQEGEKWQQLALQGPESLKILEKVIQTSLEHLPYFHFEILNFQGQKIRISRTGYTGEDGFEIYGPPDPIASIWESLLETGSPLGLLPIGLGARDSLRLEALYPLYGQELREEWTPVESGLAWAVGIQNPPFLGFERILKHKKEGAPGQVMGFQLQEGPPARSGYNVWNEKGDQRISRTLSAAYSPILKCGIGTLYLPGEHAQEHAPIQIEIRDKLFPARLHQGPFIPKKTFRPKGVLS